MKSKIFLLGLFLVIGLAACNDDNDDFVFDPELMHYDGANANAPVLPAGRVETAVEFGRDAMEFYSGKKIDAIQYFIYSVPPVCNLVIYRGGPSDEPGSVIYQKDIAGQLTENSWNEIQLDSLVSLPNDEIWISLQVEQAQGLQVIGCDSGPAENGGDWMFETTDNQWLTFRTRSGDDINWNIRASVVD